MKKIYLILSITLLLGSCVSNQNSPDQDNRSEPKVIINSQPEPLKEIVSEDKSDVYKKLVFNIKLSVSSAQTHWVLFSNGTYIIFPSGTSEKDMRKSALGLLQRFNKDRVTVRKSPLVKGWITTTSKGINNYISLDQAGDRMITNQKLKVLGKQNIMDDKKELLIVHVNKKRK